MLTFRVKRSAKVFDNQLGSGQIWVSDPGGIQYRSDADSEVGDIRPQQVGWRTRWNDSWEWIDAHWLPDQSTVYIDEIMKLEEGKSVMFFVPEGNGNRRSA